MILLHYEALGSNGSGWDQVKGQTSPVPLPLPHVEQSCAFFDFFFLDKTRFLSIEKGFGNIHIQ